MNKGLIHLYTGEGKGKILSRIGGRLSACPVSGSDDDLSVYPYAGYGFPGGGAGPSDGWHLVLLHDRGV